MVACQFHASGQSLDERLDEEQFLRGLSEYRLPEIFDAYVESHPTSDGVVVVLREIARRRLDVGSPDTSPAARIEGVEEILAARGRLIEAHPMDDRRAVWLADQATDLYFLLYGAESTDIAAEFGLPTPAQSERARRVGREMDALAAEAELAITETILNLESAPGFEDDVRLQITRRRLARDERDRRIPFLRAAGAYLHARFNLDDPDDQRAGYELASQLLEPLVRDLEGLALLRARLCLGLALARLGDEARATTHLDAARTMEEAQETDQLVITLSALVAIEESRGPEMALAALDAIEAAQHDPALFRLFLLTDRRFILMRSMAERAPVAADRRRLLFEAFSTYTALLDEDLGVPPETVRAAVFARLAIAADDGAPLDQLPPIVSVARAENLARDEATRDEAMELFDVCLAREDLDETARALALFGAARLRLESDDRLEAAIRFEQLAREFPRDRQSEAAIELAAAILTDLHERSPGDADVGARLESAIALLIERYPNLPSIERWRYEAGRLRFEERDFAAAKERFAAVAPASQVWSESRIMLARTVREEAASAPEQSRRGMIEAAIPQYERFAASLAESLEREGAPERAALLRDWIAQVTVFAAEAMLESGRASEAIDRLAGIESDPDLDRGVIGSALSIRIRAYQSLGKEEEARQEVSRFLESMPDQVGQVAPAMLASLQVEVTRLIEAGREQEARERAARDLVPLAEAIQAWMSALPAPPADVAVLHIRVGDAFAAAGEFDKALVLYDTVLAADPGALEAVIGRAESLFGLERWEEAMVEFKRVSAARRTQMDAAFWLSELRLLQVLDKAQQGTNQIRPRLERLRLMDSSFGGDRFRREFESLQNKYR